MSFVVPLLAVGVCGAGLAFVFRKQLGTLVAEAPAFVEDDLETAMNKALTKLDVISQVEGANAAPVTGADDVGAADAPLSTDQADDGAADVADAPVNDDPAPAEDTAAQAVAQG